MESEQPGSGAVDVRRFVRDETLAFLQMLGFVVGWVVDTLGDLLHHRLFLSMVRFCSHRCSTWCSFLHQPGHLIVETLSRMSNFATLQLSLDRFICSADSLDKIWGLLSSANSNSQCNVCWWGFEKVLVVLHWSGRSTFSCWCLCQTVFGFLIYHIASWAFRIQCYVFRFSFWSFSLVYLEWNGRIGCLVNAWRCICRTGCHVKSANLWRKYFLFRCCCYIMCCNRSFELNFCFFLFTAVQNGFGNKGDVLWKWRSFGCFVTCKVTQ